jgi:hypothetical protein
MASSLNAAAWPPRQRTTLAASQRVTIGDDIAIYPKGIIDHEDGYFAPVTDALSAFAATIVQ